jgi:hypothetical protein
MEESTMSYAVFKDGDRISRPFQTEGDAWDCANDAGLVEMYRVMADQFKCLMVTVLSSLATSNL